MDEYEKQKIENIDSDGDGLSDYEEIYIYGTDPYDPDTDGDGMSDGDEVKAGRNPRGPGKLQDLFVPHAGNNYHPHILKPKRIAMYALSVLLVKVVVVGLAVLLPMTAWLTPDIAAEESLKIIRLSNEVRVENSVEPLFENPILSQSAFRKAEDMLIKQYFAHTGPDKRNLADWLLDSKYTYSVAGENLAMGFANAEDVVVAWKKSPTHYANLIDPDFTEIGVAMASGPYQGYDTTFIAQFFGTPKEKFDSVFSQLAFLPIAPLQVATSTANDNEIEKVEDSNQEVESVKVRTSVTVIPAKAPLIAPLIVSPQFGYATSSNLIILDIKSPGADTVEIYQGEERLASEKVLDAKASVSVYLEIGENEIYAVAIRDTEKIKSEAIKLVIDQSGPEFDASQTIVELRSVPADDSKAINAEILMSPDTEKAVLSYDNYRIDLARQPDSNIWAGSTVIYSKIDKNAFAPTTLASITATDNLGNVQTTDLPWTQIESTKASAVDQYLYQRDHQNKYVQPIFGFSDIYYKILLVLAILFLLINVLVQIRKQHPHVILSMLGFIALTGLLIII